MSTEFPDFELRLGCVAYRDWCDNEDRLELFEFNKQISAFESFVGGLAAKGGGDTPEDVLGGLQAACRLDWQSKLRVLFHICDAPPHGKEYTDCADDYPDGHPKDPTLMQLLQSLRDRNIHLCIAKLNPTVEKMIRVFTDSGRSVGLTIEERGVSSSDKLLDAVQKTLASLTKMRENIRKCVKTCDQIEQKLDGLRYETETEVKKADEAMGGIKEDLNGFERLLDAEKDGLLGTREELTALQATHLVVVAYSRNANTEEEIDEAEEKIVDLSFQLTDVNEKFNKSRTVLDNALAEILKKQAELASLTDEVARKKAEKEAKINSINDEIAQLRTKIDKIEDRSAPERREIRKKVCVCLREIRGLCNADRGLQERAFALRSQILAIFKGIKDNTLEVTKCKEELEVQFVQLDRLLNELEEKSA